MQKYISMLFVFAFILTGCEKKPQSIEAREENDPHVAAGQTYMDQGKWNEAVAEFKQALNNEPRMARPHLDLATIYQNNKNYVYAIYHYDRYLELRPNSEKVAYIQEQKRQVVNDMVKALITNSSDVKQVLQERNQLIQQNNELKRKLTAALNNPQPARAPIEKNTSGQTADPVTSKPEQPLAAGAAKHQIYHVVSGDTLTKISTKFYGNAGKWDVILDANSDTLSSPRDLKVGQTLVIPAVGN